MLVDTQLTMTDFASTAASNVNDAVNGTPMTLEQLQQKLAETTTALQNVDTVRRASTSAGLTTSFSSTAGTTSTYKHNDYYNKIGAYGTLRQKAEIRTISHNFAIEKMWMLSESGQQSKMEEFVYSYCGKEYTWGEESTTEKKDISEDEATNRFMDALKLDIKAQHDVNVSLMEIDHTVRKEYLQEQLRLVGSMVDQQEVLIQSLSDWSHYMDQRADEYSQMYERLDVVTNTTKRKDVFEVQDLRALDGWNRFLTNVFWVLLVLLLVMVVVQHYTELSAMAKQLQSKTAVVADQATTTTTPDESN